jgi:hypothetical protein
MFWWIICFLLISNIVFFAIVRVNQRNMINKLQNRYNIARASQTIKVDDNQERFSKAKEDFESFKGKLPEKKDFAEVAAELLAIIKRHEINIGNTVYKPESVDVKGLFKYTTSLNIKGSYPSLKALLADIQESKTLFCIENLSISNLPGEDFVEMKIKIATYFR